MSQLLVILILGVTGTGNHLTYSVETYESLR